MSDFTVPGHEPLRPCEAAFRSRYAGKLQLNALAAERARSHDLVVLHTRWLPHGVAQAVKKALRKANRAENLVVSRSLHREAIARTFLGQKPLRTTAKTG